MSPSEDMLSLGANYSFHINFIGSRVVAAGPMVKRPRSSREWIMASSRECIERSEYLWTRAPQIQRVLRS